MKILFLDANILFSTAYRENAGLSKLWKIKNIKLSTSLYAIEEARRNLKMPEQLLRLEALLLDMKLISITSILNTADCLKLREKDRPILAAAVTAKADYLITGDHRDFGPFFEKKIADILVLTPAQYFALIK